MLPHCWQADCRQWASTYAKKVSSTNYNNTVGIFRHVLNVAAEAGVVYGNVAATAGRAIPRSHGRSEALNGNEMLMRSAQLEKIDTIARRTFGLNDAASSTAALSLNVLTNHSIVQVAVALPANSDTQQIMAVYIGGPLGIISHDLRHTPVQFQLLAHLLHGCSERFDLLLLLCAS